MNEKYYWDTVAWDTNGYYIKSLWFWGKKRCKIVFDSCLQLALALFFYKINRNWFSFLKKSSKVGASTAVPNRTMTKLFRRLLEGYGKTLEPRPVTMLLHHWVLLYNLETILIYDNAWFKTMHTKSICFMKLKFCLKSICLPTIVPRTLKIGWCLVLGNCFGAEDQRSNCY